MDGKLTLVAIHRCLFYSTRILVKKLTEPGFAHLHKNNGGSRLVVFWVTTLIDLNFFNTDHQETKPVPIERSFSGLSIGTGFVSW